MDGRNDEDREEIYDDNDDDDDDAVSSAEMKYTALQDKNWNSMLRRLFAYKNKFDSVDITKKNCDDCKLGQWVQTQRQRYEQKRVSSDRIRKLESIGFNWTARGAYWIKMYNKLIEYKKRFDSVDVSYKYDDDQGLGSWVDNQRQLYRKKMITFDRTKKLESIGFIWNMNTFDIKWMNM